MKRILKTVLVTLALFGVVAVASAPPQVGTLYTRDISGSMRMTCTVSLVEAIDFNVIEHEVLLLTAAHCVDDDLVETNNQWRSKASFVASFDDRSFHEVRIFRVGVAEAGYDLALMYFTEEVPTAEPWRVGDWADVDVGTAVINYANPMGLGLQAFTGYVSMLSLDRPVYQGSINWNGNSVGIIPVAGGSSGSLVLEADTGRVIGVLIGTISSPGSTPFTIFVPQRKFAEFLTSDSAGRDIVY